jgi:hypothetical protein
MLGPHVVPDLSQEHGAFVFRVKQLSTLLRQLDPEDEGTVLLHNTRNYKPSDIVSPHHRRLKYSLPHHYFLNFCLFVRLLEVINFLLSRIRDFKSTCTRWEENVPVLLSWWVECRCCWLQY